MAMTTNQATTMRAFATLGAYAPTKADYNYIVNYFDTHGEQASYQALNDAYASYTDAQLAKMLLDTTYLNQIDLEGDGNTNNLNVATDFIRANAGNRVGAMLDLTRELSKITTGPLAQIAKTYNDTIEKGYAYTSGTSSSTPLPYNFPKKIDGSAGNDVLYVDNSGVQKYVAGGINQSGKAVWVFNTSDKNDSTQQLGALKGPHFDSLPSWGQELQINYRGLYSQKIALDDKSDYTLSAQEVNQAIKQAINNDVVLSKLLGVVDGPNNTLKVLSSVDGEHSKDALSIDIAFSGNIKERLTPEVVDGFFAKHPAGDPGAETEDGMALVLAFANLGLNSSYKTKMGRSDDNSLVTGKNAGTVQSHVVEGAGGDDVIVLSSTKAAVHDIVQFNGIFGHDTIVNFSPSGANYDKFDFGILHRTDYGVKTTLHKTEITSGIASVVGQVTDGQIRLVQKYVSAGTTTSTSDNDSAEDVKQLFNDAHTGTAAKQLYIAVDHATATGDVYQVVDGAGANDLEVTLLGHITLANHADTHAAFSWSSLSDSNFV